MSACICPLPQGWNQYASISPEFLLDRVEAAWLGRSKCPPEQDPVAVSLYDLEYSEGTSERSPGTLQENDSPTLSPDGE